MCYFEFNDILFVIVVLDVDVIIIEILCLDMELLMVFVDFKYLNDIGFGVYDIYSFCVLMVVEVEYLLCKVLNVILKECLWVNLDCGLKICGWIEIID